MEQHVLHLFDYHHWATKRLLDHVRGLPRELWSMEVRNVFDSISDTFSHLITVDQLWLERVSGVVNARASIHPLRDVYEAIDLIDRVHTAFMARLSAEEAIRTVVYENSKGEKFQDTISEIVTHVVNHGTYHRGNIASMIRQLGHTGIATDYIFFLREKKA